MANEDSSIPTTHLVDDIADEQVRRTHGATLAKVPTGPRIDDEGFDIVQQRILGAYERGYMEGLRAARGATGDKYVDLLANADLVVDAYAREMRRAIR